MQVKELMSRELVMIGPTESCLDAVVRMQRAHVRHLPVVNRDGSWSGSWTDATSVTICSPPGLRDTRFDRVDVLLDGCAWPRSFHDVMTVESGETSPTRRGRCASAGWGPLR